MKPTRKRTGPAARTKGTQLKEGRAVKVMTYPRPATKAVLVKAAESQNRPLSNFMVISSVERAAKELGKKVKRLIPPDEYRELYGTTA